MVTFENYEEYMMLDADGELDSAGRAALQAFIAAHPALAEEYAAWQSLKLRPDTSITYDDKDSLRKQESGRKVIGFRPLALAAAAAVLAALLLIPALRERKAEPPVIAHVMPNEEPAVPVKDVYADSMSRPGVPPRKEKPAKTRKPGNALPDTRLASGQPAEVPVESSKSPDSMLALHPVHPQTVTGQVLPMPLAVQASILEPARVPAEEPDRAPLITWAPENRKAFQQLKAAVEARVTQVTAAARTIKETALVIRLGNNSVNLNN